MEKYMTKQFQEYKHQFLLEMFKFVLKDDNFSPHNTVNLKIIEMYCEEWAEMSMRKVNKSLKDKIEHPAMGENVANMGSAKMNHAEIPLVQEFDEVEPIPF